MPCAGVRREWRVLRRTSPWLAAASAAVEQGRGFWRKICEGAMRLMGEKSWGAKIGYIIWPSAHVQ